MDGKSDADGLLKSFSLTATPNHPSVLCFGGTFNPIHNGHLISARLAAERAGFKSTLLIPSGSPPQRMDQFDLANEQARLTMCQLAIRHDADFAVSDVETGLGRPAFTIETVRRLKADGWSEVHWLIGSDSVPRLSTWHAWEELLEQVQFVVMLRPGHQVDWNSLPASVSRLREWVVPTPQIDISATTIRERSRRGQSIRFLTPDLVADYIADRGLYRPHAIE